MKPTYFDLTVVDLGSAKAFFEQVLQWRFEKIAILARTDRDWPPPWETPPAMWFMGHPPTKPRLVGGYTPLKIARERRHDEIVRILLQAGARE